MKYKYLYVEWIEHRLVYKDDLTKGTVSTICYDRKKTEQSKRDIETQLCIKTFDAYINQLETT